MDREVDIFGGVSPILALFELMLAFNFEHFNEFPMYILFIPLGFISIFLFVFKLLVTLKNKGYELQFLSVVIDILFIFLFILFLIPVSLRFYSESAPIIGFFIILFVRLAGDIGFDFSEKGFIGFLFQQEGFGKIFFLKNFLEFELLFLKRRILQLDCCLFVRFLSNPC